MIQSRMRAHARNENVSSIDDATYLTGMKMYPVLP